MNKKDCYNFSETLGCRAENFGEKCACDLVGNPREFVVEFANGKPARLLDSESYASEGAVRFIEKSAYDKLRKDWLRSARSAADKQVDLETLKRTPCEFRSTCLVDQTSLSIAVEAMKDAKTELRKDALLNEAGKRAYDILYDELEKINGTQDKGTR